MEIAVTLQRVEQGWIASAPEARATAQGKSRDDALTNLLDLLHTYPDLLDDVREASTRQVELVRV